MMSNKKNYTTFEELTLIDNDEIKIPDINSLTVVDEKCYSSVEGSKVSKHFIKFFIWEQYFISVSTFSFNNTKIIHNSNNIAFEEPE